MVSGFLVSGFWTRRKRTLNYNGDSCGAHVYKRKSGWLIMTFKFTILCNLIMLSLASVAGAAELQAKTVDGQVIQGEYLGTENDIVSIKTIYGLMAIPSRNI